MLKVYYSIRNGCTKSRVYICAGYTEDDSIAGEALLYKGRLEARLYSKCPCNWFEEDRRPL